MLGNFVLCNGTIDIINYCCCFCFCESDASNAAPKKNLCPAATKGTMKTPSCPVHRGAYPPVPLSTKTPGSFSPKYTLEVLPMLHTITTSRMKFPHQTPAKEGRAEVCGSGKNNIRSYTFFSAWKARARAGYAHIRRDSARCGSTTPNRDRNRRQNPPKGKTARALVATDRPEQTSRGFLPSSEALEEAKQKLIVAGSIFSVRRASHQKPWFSPTVVVC